MQLPGALSGFKTTIVVSFFVYKSTKIVLLFSGCIYKLACKKPCTFFLSLSLLPADQAVAVVLGQHAQQQHHIHH